MLDLIAILPETEMYPLPLSMSLDSEIDYVSQEERNEALAYADDFIKENNIKPLPIGKFSQIPEITVLYIPEYQELNYADVFSFT